MRKPERQHKINTDIRYLKLRVIGFGEPKILPFNEAFKIAQEEGKDLILISENGDLPIVKIEEYNKFLYNLEKKTKRN